MSLTMATSSLISILKVHNQIRVKLSMTVLANKNTPYMRTPHAMFYWEQTGFIRSKQSYQSQTNGKLSNYMDPSDQQTKVSVKKSIVQL